jgi:hypothetical protein
MSNKRRPGRPATLAHFRSHVQAIVRDVGREFTEADDDWPMAMFMQTPLGIECFQLDESLFASARAKNALDEWLRRLVVGRGAFRYGLLLNAHRAPPEMSDEDRARIERGELRYADLPGAPELLLLTVGDAESEEHWLAEIRRQERRPPTLLPWRRSESYEGRFLGLNELMGQPAA